MSVCAMFYICEWNENIGQRQPKKWNMKNNDSKALTWKEWLVIINFTRPMENIYNMCEKFHTQKIWTPTTAENTFPITFFSRTDMKFDVVIIKFLYKVTRRKMCHHKSHTHTHSPRINNNSNNISSRVNQKNLDD